MTTKETERSVQISQKKKTLVEYGLLAIILLGVLAIKIFFVAQTPYPAYDSYYGIRQVNEIITTGLPEVVDEYSYQGRINLTSIAFYYILAFLQLFIPAILLFKYFSIVLSSLALYLVFRISRQLFPERWLAILLTAIAALTPSIFVAHLNTLIPSSLFVVLYLFLVKLLLDLDKKKYLIFFTLIIILATLVSSLSVVLIVGLLFYLFLVKLEGLKIRRREVELIFFGSLFVLWFHLLLYKKLFLTYGSGALWASIPRSYLASFFSGLTVPLATSLIGIIPLILGLYGVYHALFRVRNKRMLLFVSLFFSFSLFTWFGFLPIQEGLLYTALTLIILGGYTLRVANDFLEDTIIAKWKPTIVIAFLILLVVGFSPVLIYQDTIQENAPTHDEIETLTAMSEFLPEDATILGHIKEGHLITAVAKRKNFYDENFIFAPNARQRFDDARTIYLSKSAANSLNQLQYYGIDYIYESRLTTQEYARTSNQFSQGDCFKPIYNTSTTTVYRILCELEN